MCIFAFTLKWAINLHLLFLRAGLCLTVCISPQDRAYLKLFAESYEKLWSPHVLLVQKFKDNTAPQPDG